MLKKVGRSVRLSYSHNQPDANNEFYLQVRAENRGYGIARNLKLDLSRVNVLPDLDGNSRSLLFDLKRTLLDGATKPAAYILDFGDIQPDQSKTGRWEIELKAGDGSSIQDAWITGFAVTCDHRPYKGHLLSDLLFCGPVNQFFLAGECPFCGLSDKNATVGGPINTANGNYHYSQSAPGIPTIANPLRLAWSFNSLQVGAHPDFAPVTTTLGLAWTHNYDLRLTISDLRLGEGLTGGVTIKAFHGTPLHFEWAKDRYVAAPGVRGMLTRTEVLTNQYVYTLTAVNQAVYVFDDEGQLTAQYDPRGNVTTFTYNGQDHLTRVAEPTSGRYLDFSYDGQGRLETVTDPISRATQFGYDGGGLLTSVTDTRGQVWQYAYTEVITGGYALARVTDPDGRIVEATGFDSLGRAISQTFRGEDLALAYHPDGRRTIADALDRETVHIYNSLGLLVGSSDPLGEVETFVLDGDYNRTYSENQTGDPAFYERTPLGLTTAITDALGNTTRFEYDANNNPTKMVNALGGVTYRLYDGQNNFISMTNVLGNETLYSHNIYGQMVSLTDESGNTTAYAYDTLGNQIVMTDTLGNVTTYEYDAIGRVITTTDTQGKVALLEFRGLTRKNGYVPPNRAKDVEIKSRPS